MKTNIVRCFINIMILSCTALTGCGHDSLAQWNGLRPANVESLVFWKGDAKIEINDPQIIEYFFKSLRNGYAEESKSEEMGRTYRIEAITRQGTLKGYLNFTRPSLCIVLLTSNGIDDSKL